MASGASFVMVLVVEVVVVVGADVEGFAIVDVAIGDGGFVVGSGEY